jgi:hypothetical protein
MQEYRKLDPLSKSLTLRRIARELGPDWALLAAAVVPKGRSPKQARALRDQLAPLYETLFFQINSLPGGLAFLVELRGDVLACIKTEGDGNRCPELRELSVDLHRLLSSWFHVGLLQLRCLTFEDPASLIEQLMAHERVIPIGSLQECRQRMGFGRRCFAFFHPSMPDTPLVFVWVALTHDITSNLQGILHSAPDKDEQSYSTAMFYSINSVHPGLAGVELGNFLIKRVVRTLQLELPGIQTYSTLSPIPGFRAWLTAHLEQATADRPFVGDLVLPGEKRALLARLSENYETSAACEIPTLTGSAALRHLL